MGDSYALLVNEGARSNKLSGLYTWKRNPMFYISVATALFSIFGMMVHAVWGFTIGISVSLFTIILSSWFAAAIVDHYPLPPRSVSSWVKLKTGFFVIFFLAIYTALIYLQVIQIAVYFASGARTGDAWSAFPTECRPSPTAASSPMQSPHINCVRAGIGIPNPVAAPGSDAIQVPVFATDLSDAIAAFRGILDQREDFRDCHLLVDVRTTDNSTHFLHWRCLSPFLGYPDDFAIQLSCQASSVLVWFHSQARLDDDNWDHGINDARVRLALGYALLPNNWYPYSAQLNTSASCT